MREEMDVRKNIEVKQGALRELLASRVELEISVKHVNVWVVRAISECGIDVVIDESITHTLEAAINQVSRAYGTMAAETPVLVLMSRTSIDALPNDLQYVADRSVGDSWWCPWYNTILIRNAKPESICEVLCRQIVVSLLWNDSTATRFPAAVVEGEAIWRFERVVRHRDAELLAWSRGIIARKAPVDIQTLFATSYDDAADGSELGVWGNTDFIARAALAVGLLHRLATQNHHPMPAIVQDVMAGPRSASISDAYRAFCRWRAE